MFSFQGTQNSFLRNSMKFLFRGTSVNFLKEVVGQNGLEPSTSRLSVVCSSQLSYWPVVDFFLLVEISGIEPLTSCLQGRRSPSWAKPPYRRNQTHNLRFEIEISNLNCVFVSPLKSKPASLGFVLVPLSGGEYRDRTGDLLLARQALSQLS